jgi:spore maturation protein CgeB
VNHLHQNLSMIATRHPDLADRIRGSEEGPLVVTPARNGMPTAAAGGLQVHSAYDPWKEALAWADKQVTHCRAGELVVVMGVGLLYQVEALRQRLPSDIPVAVVVPEPRDLHQAFAARAMEQWLGAIHWMWGTPEEIAARLRAMSCPLRVVAYAPACRLHATKYCQVEEALRKQAAEQAGGQLHVAVVGPVYGGSLPIARYTVSALEALGHRVTWIDHSLHATSYNSMDTLKDGRLRQTMRSRFVDWLSLYTQVQLAENPPDLVLALAQAPLNLPVLEHLRRKKFLTAMWFVENHRHLTYWQQLAGSYEFWFVIQRGACFDNLRHAGARHVAYLPLAADLTVHRPVELTPDEQAEFGSDVSFVGAGYSNRRVLLPQLIKPEWTFKLWGNEWEQAPALAGTLQRNGARVDTATCVKIFNATKVNVNLHSFTGEGLDPEADFVNPRTFELAACGAFQVLDQRSLLPDLFEPDQVAVFTKGEDLPNLVKMGLDDPATRVAMAQASQRRVREAHTYTHRMKELLGAIGVASPDRVGSILRGTRQAGALAQRPEAPTGLVTLLKQFPSAQRIELEDVAVKLRAKGPGAVLGREELLLLMLDEYRQEVRDFV